MALSIDLRKRILDAYQNNEGSIRILAERFKASPSTIWDLIKRYRDTHKIGAESPPGRTPKVDKTGEQLIEKYVKKYPDATLSQIQTYLKTSLSLDVGISTVHRTCERIKLTYKKNAISRRTKAS